MYPAFVLIAMWLSYWGDFLFPGIKFYQYGVIPGEVSTLPGVLLMPFIHDHSGYEHIVNNSIPTAILLGTLIFYYRDIAGRVILFSWVLTGLGLWVFAANNNAYHIGMSGVIYALAGFLFTSGVLRKYRPLQAISLFVVFVYGSMIWGIFPMDTKVSWEGHLAGLVTGVVLAVIFRKRGPKPPKYLYEIEKEMGIEPPDFEGQWRALQQAEEERKKEIERAKQGFTIVYHYKPKMKDDNDQ